MFLEDGRGLGIVQQTIVQTTLWGVVGLRTEINYFAHIAVGKVLLLTKYCDYEKEIIRSSVKRKGSLS